MKRLIADRDGNVPLLKARRTCMCFVLCPNTAGLHNLELQVDSSGPALYSVLEGLCRSLWSPFLARVARPIEPCPLEREITHTLYAVPKQ